ncbi:MAG TPA: tyrosine-type recombinase/integrase [Candidatus Dormibacteraeota bacterium]|jgi:integrase
MARGRRGNREGSICQIADGRWLAQVTMPDGRRRRWYGRTRAAAHDKLVAALTEVGRGVVAAAPAELTLADYLTGWLMDVKPSLRPSAWGAYERHLRNHALPTLGRKRLVRLEPTDLRALYRRLVDGGLSPTTVRHVHGVLRRALGQAARDGLVARNVAALVTPPRRAEPGRNVLDPDQARAFLEAARGDRLEALYVLAVTTGMREGELLALRWADVDLSAGVVSVRGTKTAGSRRQVALTNLAVAALRHRREAAAVEAGIIGNPGDLVFPSTAGTPILASNLIRRSFAPLLGRAALPRIRFHDLRHTAATLMLGRGVHPKIVSEMLGHATIAITLDLYSHVTPTMQAGAAAELDALLR